MSDFAARLAALSNKASATTLEHFLTLYSKASYDCNINYRAGVRELYEYLSPITLPYKEFPEIESEWLVPDLAGTWEMHEIAAIVSGQDASFSSGAYKAGLARTRLFERAIFLVWFNKILPSRVASIHNTYGVQS